MRAWKKLLAYIIASFAAISLLHVWLNIGFGKLGRDGLSAEGKRIQVGFLPVT
jgi:hypothetical protein